MNPWSPNCIASGGFDQCLHLMDVTALTSGSGSAGLIPVCTQRMEDVVGSVRWSQADTNAITCTTDGGDLLVLDTRAMGRPALALHTHTQLYTHAFVSPHEVLLGFGDGRVRALDLRMAATCAPVAYEAQVGAVGDFVSHPGNPRVVAAFGTLGTTLLRVLSEPVEEEEEEELAPVVIVPGPTPRVVCEGKFNYTAGARPPAAPQVPTTTARHCTPHPGPSGRLTRGLLASARSVDGPLGTLSDRVGDHGPGPQDFEKVVGAFMPMGGPPGHGSGCSGDASAPPPLLVASTARGDLLTFACPL